jgi:glyoxylase-like metal-dependent hydrolase (beta-lactamase superfamily II)
MEIHEIQSGLFVCVGDAYDSNSTVLIKNDQVLLIDSMAATKDALELKEFVETKLLKKVRFIICTHYFSDHLAGLKLFPESEIVAHKNYLHTFDSELYRSEEEKSNFVEPTILILEGLSFRWGPFLLNLFYNPGHTMDMINIDIQEADLIHVGDTLVGNMVYFQYSPPRSFLTALEEIKKKGRKNLISSHSTIRSVGAVDYALHYLNSLGEKSKEAWENGSEESIARIDLNSCLPSGVEGTSFENIFHKRNLQSIVKRRLFAKPEKEDRSLPA